MQIQRSGIESASVLDYDIQKEQVTLTTVQTLQVHFSSHLATVIVPCQPRHLAECMPISTFLLALPYCACWKFMT